MLETDDKCDGTVAESAALIRELDGIIREDRYPYRPAS